MHRHSIKYNKRLAFITCCFFSVPLPAFAVECSRTLDDPRLHQLQSDALAETVDAQYELGLAYEYGQGITQDDAIAACWYKQAALAQHSNAQYRLAVLYDNGWGLAANKAQAVKLYGYAAEQGHQLAQHDLAIMHFEGTGTVKDLVQAYKWLRIADASGNELMNKHLAMVSAQMNLVEIEKAEQLVQLWLLTRR